MEGHPIPQDINSFEFKLIGDMTIKQFAYIAIGVVIAWITFSLPILGLIKIPLAAIFALLGVSLAFLPIGGRPLDTMAYNFFKALFAPSQYVYQKTEDQTPVPTIQQPKPTAFIAVEQKQQPLAASVAVAPVSNSPVFHQPPHIITSSVVAPKIEEPKAEEPKPEEEKKEKEEVLKKEEQYIEQEIQTAKTQEAAAVNTPSAADMHSKVLELEKLLQETASQRLELERQISQLQQQLTNQTQNSAPTVRRQTSNVRSVPDDMRKSVGIPIAPEYPNLLTGIIKDPRGNPLPNILVEVKDKEGNPIRAFKTNGLGQFQSATAFTNGTYDIAFEDPRGQNQFDAVEISASGKIIPPLEIISKDKREELRKALFS